MAQQRHGTAFVVGATLGGVAGAVWGLLNATETGAAARAGLGRRLEAGADWLVVSAAELEVTTRAWFARKRFAAEEPVLPPDDHHVWDPATAAAAAEDAAGVLPVVEGAGGPDEVVG